MTTDQKLTMIKSAIKTLAETNRLNNKLKQRGLNSLEQAYARYREETNEHKLLTNHKRLEC